MTPIFLGEVKFGRLALNKPKEFAEYVAKLKGTVQITVEKPKSIRSLRQNAYLWGVVYALISEHTGFHVEEVHELCKKKFLTYEKAYKRKLYKFTRSTASLNKDEFAMYLDKVIQLAAELGIVVPDPEEVKL